MKMFYSGKEIAERYSTETIKLTETNIRNWTKKGMKHIIGPHNLFLYKIEWVEEFIERQAELNSKNEKIETFTKKEKINRNRKIINKCDFENCKVV